MLRLNKDEYIDEEKIPQPLRKRLDWNKVFRSIPVGKARIIRPDEAHYTTVRQALTRLQAKGMFPHFRVMTRKIGNRRICYVINTHLARSDIT